MTNAGDMLVISSISEEKQTYRVKCQILSFSAGGGRKKMYYLEKMFQENHRRVKSLFAFLLSNTKEQ